MTKQDSNKGPDEFHYSYFVISGFIQLLELKRLKGHYGRFSEILSQNWGMNFCSCGFIFILFLNILAAKAEKTVDHVLKS